MCILDLLSNSSSSKSEAETAICSNNEKSPLVPKRISTELIDFNNNFMFHQKREWDVKTVIFDFSSERSSIDENEIHASSCTLCTSSFSFCNASQHSTKYSEHNFFLLILLFTNIFFKT